MIIQERAKPKHFSYTLFTFPFSSSEFQWCFKRLSFFSAWSKHGESLICKRVNCPKLMLLSNSKKGAQFHKLSPNVQQIGHGNSQNAAF